MFAARYFGPRYFATRYFPKIGAVLVAGVSRGLLMLGVG